MYFDVAWVLRLGSGFSGGVVRGAEIVSAVMI